MLLKLSVNGLLAIKLKVIKNITLFNNAFIKTLSDKLGMKGCNAVMNILGNKQRILRKEKNLGKEKDAKKAKINIDNKSPILNLF